MAEILNISPNAKTGKLPLYKAGDRYGKLTLTGKSYSKNNTRRVEYICECGTIGWAFFCNIRSKNHTTSCGCVATKLFQELITSHGLCRHPLYQIWGDIIDRCNNSKNICFPNYGAKGVKMCDEWRNDFKSFYDWCMSHGYKKGLDLDKDKLSTTKPGLLYSPEYCCFISRKENVRNRSITKMIEYKNEKKSLGEWCEAFKLSYQTVCARLNKLNWSIDNALETPVKTQYRNNRAVNNRNI